MLQSLDISEGTNSNANFEAEEGFLKDGQSQQQQPSNLNRGGMVDDLDSSSAQEGRPPSCVSVDPDLATTKSVSLKRLASSGRVQPSSSSSPMEGFLAQVGNSSLSLSSPKPISAARVMPAPSSGMGVESEEEGDEPEQQTRHSVASLVSVASTDSSTDGERRSLRPHKKENALVARESDKNLSTERERLLRENLADGGDDDVPPVRTKRASSLVMNLTKSVIDDEEEYSIENGILSQRDQADTDIRRVHSITRVHSTASVHSTSNNPKIIRRKNSLFMNEKRAIDSEVKVDLAIRFRVVFLQIVRTCYRRQVAMGWLPRGSHGASILLNSLDVALEQTDDSCGFQDFEYIRRSLNKLNWTVPEALPSHTRDTAADVENVQREHSREGQVWDFHNCLGGVLSWVAGFTFARELMILMREKHDAERILVLTSFIEAQRFAQNKITFYLGEEEFTDSPEEATILNESYLQVKRAQKMLSHINQDVMSLHVAKMAA